MINLKKYEEFSEDRINDILDKMNRKEDSTKEDEWILNNPESDVEDIPNYKEKIINEIISKIRKYGDYGFLTVRGGGLGDEELDADEAPVYDKFDGETHLIEHFNTDGVTIVIYDVDENDLGDYDLPYEKLLIQHLETINNIIDENVLKR